MAEHDLRGWLRIYGGLACALVVAACGAAVVALDTPQPLRALAASGLVLWAPGYAFSVLMFVPGAIGGAERAMLAFGGSIALTAIPAILLEATGVRLGTESFLLTAYYVTTLAVVFAVLRLWSLVDISPVPTGSGLPLLPAATAVGIGLVLAAAVLVARITPEPAAIEGSSTFAATSAGPRAMRAEVISSELATTTYRLTLRTGTEPLELARFTLPPGGSWRRDLERPISSGPIELFLYRGSDALPYRRLVVQGASA